MTKIEAIQKLVEISKTPQHEKLVDLMEVYHKDGLRDITAEEAEEFLETQKLIKGDK